MLTPFPSDYHHHHQHHHQHHNRAMFDNSQQSAYAYQHNPQLSQSRPMPIGYPQYSNYSQPLPHPHHSQQQQAPHAQAFHPQHSFASPYGPSIQTNAMAFGNQAQSSMAQNPHMPTTNADAGFIPYSTAAMDTYGPLTHLPNDFHNSLVDFPLRRFNGQAFAPHNATLSTSPTDGASCAGSDASWQMVDNPPRSSFDSLESMPNSAVSSVSNPGVTLHNRSDSDSSHQQHAGSSGSSDGSYEEIGIPTYSPQSEPSNVHTGSRPIPHTFQPTAAGDFMYLNQYSHTGSSPSSSDTSPSSPSAHSPIMRRKKESSNKVTKPAAQQKKPAGNTTVAKTGQPGDKKGRRQGPLTANKRQHACMVRKVGACVRCKFLKKTCGEGDPCPGCQPSHARLWQVPCTRMDIKELGYFVNKWDADYKRHISMEISDANIKGYSPVEHHMYITHGYGIVFKTRVRQVFVRDDSCFNVDWVETSRDPLATFEVETAHLTVGSDGIDSKTISDYLDNYIECGFFERFIDDHLNGTKFLSEMLKTAFAYYMRTRDPMIRKALKLILSYNLTQHITMIVGPMEENGTLGKIEDETSKYHGSTIAPNLINFQVKYHLAITWRSLQDEVLKELSALYTSVYSGEKLKNWPTIFMLATILLAVWEEMQFDSNYRMGDAEAAKRFCRDMEATPVGVIIGLFSAISQKLPAFKDWDSAQHHQMLNSRQEVCDAMTEVKGHVLKHGTTVFYGPSIPLSPLTFPPFRLFSHVKPLLIHVVKRNISSPARMPSLTAKTSTHCLTSFFHALSSAPTRKARMQASH